MVERVGVEAPLSAEEVRAILAICSPRGLLVGGQALAFWADRLAVDLPTELGTAVTADADFIADSSLAKNWASGSAGRAGCPRSTTPRPAPER